MRYLLALLGIIFVGGVAAQTKTLNMDVPDATATSCNIKVEATSNPIQGAGPYTVVIASKDLPIVTDSVRGKSQYNFRVCQDSPAAWPTTGYVRVTAVLKRATDNTVSATAVETFAGPPSYLTAPTGLKAQ